MATNVERRAATRARLIESARTHFARDGYEATLTNDIIEDTGLSRGAMYHHFQSKRELFEAVFVAISDETIARAAKHRSRASSPLEQLIGACFVWLRNVRDPEIATILLDQGPQVLGWKRARDLEAESSLALMERSLERAAEAGEIEVPSITLAARIVNATLAEVALAAVHRDPATPVAKQEAAVRQFIEGLRV